MKGEEKVKEMRVEVTEGLADGEDEKVMQRSRFSNLFSFGEITTL